MKRTLLLTLLLVVAGGAIAVRHHVVRDVDLFAVQTGSMGASAPIGSLVATRAPTAIRPGDIVTFDRGHGQLVTHRVTEVLLDGTLVTKGDANAEPDPWRTAPAAVRGVVDRVVPRGGYVLAYLALPVGVGSLLAALVTVLLGWRLFLGTADERRALPVAA